MGIGYPGPHCLVQRVVSRGHIPEWPGPHAEHLGPALPHRIDRCQPTDAGAHLVGILPPPELARPDPGATLLDKEGDMPMPPSSMTKLMTAYIVYGLLKAGRFNLTQELPVSDRAWKMRALSGAASCWPRRWPGRRRALPS